MEQQRQQALLEQANRIMDKADRKIWVTFRKEGIQQQPQILN